MYSLVLNALVRHINKNKINTKCIKYLKTSASLDAFWERDPKGGYIDTREKPSKTQIVREGLKELKTEIALWSQEVKEHFEFDPNMIFRPGETDIVWQFGSQDSLNEWVVTSDKDHNEGYSSCSLALNKHGKGLFAGELSTRVPKDGRIKRAGYCNIKTIRARKSFKRETFLNWGPYNMLVMKVRGDGRSYMLNITTKGFFDLTWNDTYHFVLYTRGGPYWQISRIPFSKFFFASKGRVQDRQSPIPLNKITNFGISVGDKINGSFSLEIDYIGVEFDPNHKEEFAYEMYRMPKYIVAT
ncbi:hypothetical protein ILUMI_11211 [Ignelater luminosus]|uniref:NADH:ubiquinone oxidoreductase intermediate-associated protein 30 domain-containing protein n=1 Tax=Ignelater luminosus TaxID=2038154 RepID=A0A8K0D1V9_IGNLU|nr:hypothetical protein ILUMI_11211 [Ignelater luminosus]